MTLVQNDTRVLDQGDTVIEYPGRARLYVSVNGSRITVNCCNMNDTPFPSAITDLDLSSEPDKSAEFGRTPGQKLYFNAGAIISGRTGRLYLDENNNVTYQHLSGTFRAEEPRPGSLSQPEVLPAEHDTGEMEAPPPEYPAPPSPRDGHIPGNKSSAGYTLHNKNDKRPHNEDRGGAELGPELNETEAPQYLTELG